MLIRPLTPGAVLLLCIAGAADPACADDEASNVPRITAVSHYRVFAEQNRAEIGETEIETPDGPRRSETLALLTVDGRRLSFRLDTGELVKSERVGKPSEPLLNFKPC